MNSEIHFILQGKGGIGKSFIASLLSQFFATSKRGELVNFDLDQENATFSQYKEIKASHINVMGESRVVDPKKFDALMETLLTANNKIFVIDTGANTFSNLLAYIVENGVMDMLTSAGQKAYIHAIVGGGDTLLDTANGFNSMASSTNTPIILWLNEHFGELKSTDGKAFIETKVFKTHEDALRGVILLRARNAQTYGDDIKKMNTKRLTLDQVQGSTDFSIMEKSRIKTIGKDVFDQLNKVEW